MIIYPVTHTKMDKEKSTNNNTKITKENILLKSKIAYSIGSLETINYLLKNDDPEILSKNLDHLRNTVSRVLDDLKKGV
jgi:hypothetical protein